MQALREAEVQEVLVKNPGVLGCIPRQLAKASADAIKRAASVANGFDAGASEEQWLALADLR